MRVVGLTGGAVVEFLRGIWSTMSVDTNAPASGRSKERNTVPGSTSLELKKGQVVQEFGWDEDVDEALRARFEEETGEELADEDSLDMFDGALVWWRADDGDMEDLADLLVDARSNLDNGSGIIWVMVPAHGSEGFVDHVVVDEAAQTAGLSATNAAALSETWTGVRLSARGPRR